MTELEDTITIGEYTLSVNPNHPGKVWIQHSSGEGMDTDTEKFAEYIDAYFNAYF